MEKHCPIRLEIQICYFQRALYHLTQRLVLRIQEVVSILIFFQHLYLPRME